MLKARRFLPGAFVRRPGLFLAYSFFFHCALALLLFISWPNFRKSEDLAERAVFLDLPAEPQTASPAGTDATDKRSKSSKSRRSETVLGAGGGKSLPLSSLAPGWSSSVLSGNGGDGADQEEGENAWGMMKSRAIVAPKSSGAMVWVYNKSDRVLGYPGAFIKHGIQGQATAYMRFDREGRFDRSRLEVVSDSPYLKVYVYRLLEKTFVDDVIPENFRNWEKELQVSAQIRFSFVETGAKIEVLHRIAGKRIYFNRTHAKSRMQWKAGPLAGMGPFAIGLDVLWFARKAKEVKDTIDNRIPKNDLFEYENDPLFN